jgi:phosphate/sulfate permease
MHTEFIYLLMVGILFILAVSDLIVGVSNDAINFLNSAIGSRAAKLRTAMMVAMVGILIGATFSSGMMEVARKGMFNPQFFYFRDIMILFISVMIVDVILLDIFNSFGLPTSTTVSIVFELLGAAVAIALAYNLRGNLININGTLTVGSVNEYINSKKTLEIIMGILLSIVMAFTVGSLVQYVVRIVFTFNYKKILPYAGGIFSGIALTAITYYLLIKGAKDAVFMTADLKEFIKTHSSQILIFGFLGWTILFQILTLLFKEWVLKVVVLVGTFALAMAFAGNDLVNFIGAPVAGFNAYSAYIHSGGANASTYTMEALLASIPTEGWILVIAGLIMAVALWTSKKARTVMETTIDLTRQNEGDEQFSSNYLARVMVRIGRNTGETISRFTPLVVKKWIDSRFELVKAQKSTDQPAFDLIRASVILVVSSGLIAYATSYKLPLSTTYVTFMTAMGASFADRSWGRESAVYRISGVINVIGGWFITAFAAFSGAFIVALIIYYLGTWMTLVFMAMALYVIYKTHIRHKRRVNLKEETTRFQKVVSFSESDIQSQCIETVESHIQKISDLYDDTLQALFLEKRKKLGILRKEAKEEKNNTQMLKLRLPDVLKKLETEAVPTSYHYVQIVENLNELAHTFNSISKHAFDHVDNNHKELNQEQIEDLSELIRRKNQLQQQILEEIRNPQSEYPDHLAQENKKLQQYMDECLLNQIKRVKNGISGKKNSMLFMNLISESKNLLSFETNIFRAYYSFIHKP